MIAWPVRWSSSHTTALKITRGTSQADLLVLGPNMKE